MPTAAEAAPGMNVVARDSISGSDANQQTTYVDSRMWHFWLGSASFEVAGCHADTANEAKPASCLQKHYNARATVSSGCEQVLKRHLRGQSLRPYGSEERARTTAVELWKALLICAPWSGCQLP